MNLNVGVLAVVASVAMKLLRVHGMYIYYVLTVMVIGIGPLRAGDIHFSKMYQQFHIQQQGGPL